ncbi:sigma-70 family RNA polymerase sigma factor [Spirosoma harenae]
MKSTPQIEQNLVLDLKSGSSAAFTKLYDNYSPALYGFLLRLVKDPERAQDLLQDAFIKIWSNIHAYNPQQGRLFTWLLTVTRNVAFDELRAQKARPITQSTDAAVISEVCYSGISEGTVQQALVSQLAPKHREVVELVYYREYTKQEVADELKLPLGTVKTRFRMALQHLKQLFRQDISHYHLSQVSSR